MTRVHRESHRTDRIGWLRAAVLGVNDGIVSTASPVLGVAEAGAQRSSVLVAGVAGLVAGAIAMAAGEYVSVPSQADTEAGDLARERKEPTADVPAERRVLAVRPVQAAQASAASVTIGAALSLVTAVG